MQLHEMIRLQGAPFPEPLPVPVGDLIARFSEIGYSFKEDDGSIVLRGVYEPGRLDAIQLLISELSPNIDLRHSAWTTYDQSDYSSASLWVVHFPDVWVEGLDFRTQCVTCGTKHISVDTTHRVPSIDSDKPFASINGQFAAVRRDAYSKYSECFAGSLVAPLDEEGRYYYLLSRSRLQRLIIHPDEALGLRGSCGTCHSPLFRMLFGPLRYPKSDWNGDAVVYSSWLDKNVYSPSAARVISKADKSIKPSGIVVLE